MNLVAFDLETTGVDPFNDVPVSCTLGEVSFYINPGRTIPDEVVAIHGITNEMAANGESLQLAIMWIIEGLYHHWKHGETIIGMNVSYDLTMIDACMRRFFDRELQIGPVIDVLVIDRTFDKYRKGPRKLGALCEHYGVVLENAHTSSADAQACIDIFSKMLYRWPSLDNVNNAKMAAWYVAWLEHYSEYLVKQGSQPIPKGRYSWPIHKENV